MKEVFEVLMIAIFSGMAVMVWMAVFYIWRGICNQGKSSRLLCEVQDELRKLRGNLPLLNVS